MPYFPPASSGGSGLPTTGGTMTGTITSTLGTLTGADKPFFSGTATWNDAAVAFNGIKLNVTNTASADASLLQDLQVAGVSQFNVSKGGVVTGKSGFVQTTYGNSTTVASTLGNSAGTYGLTILNGDGNLYYIFNSVAAVVLGSNAAGRGVGLGNTGIVSWAPGGPADTTGDTGLGRNAASVVEVNNGTYGTYGTYVAKEFRFAAPTSANGQFLAVKSLTELTTIAAAATTDTTIQMPAGAIILAVSVRVTTAIPTATTFTVGDSGSAARFNTGTNVAVAAGTTDAGTKAGAYYNASALSVRITPSATPAANTGRVRVTVHYLATNPPTS